jgi:hypothetical protein
VQPNPRLRLRVIHLLFVSCIVLFAWIILLGVTLPKRYDADHWNLAWIGFDVALLIGIAGTAWAAWRRRVVIVLFATATATLLLADTWFDVTTARSKDLGVSVLQAAFIEVPFALFLLYVVRRVIHYTRGTIWSDQQGTRPKSLFSVEFPHPSEVPMPGPLGDIANETLD